MKYFSTLILVSALTVAIAQSPFDEVKQDLAFYGDVVMNAASGKHRLRSNEELLRGVQSFLQMENSFDVPLNDVPWISTVGSDSANFRILTWQVNVNDSSYRSHGFIQMADGRSFQLTDEKPKIEALYRTLDTAHWYGVRYYKMHPFIKSDKIFYLLFGFHANDQWNRQKIVDVLYFDDGVPKFGYPVFTHEEKSADRYGASRIILTYSSNARVTLDFDNQLNMIVHDHLIPMRGRFDDQRETFVGDGTFVGYKLNANGEWIFREKLFEETSDDPLDDGVDRDGEAKKDLFGREKHR